VDDPRRIVIAVGFVEEVIPSVEHNHTDAGTLRSYTWETMIRHSIRENGENGFLMPYYKLMEYAKDHSDFDIRLATVYASEDYHYVKRAVIIYRFRSYNAGFFGKRRFLSGI
ncbi:MAG: hypothetical protein IJP90_00325, partial [Treponema sp.]|nr:hypothetical protein [Treponema sp.]